MSADHRYSLRWLAWTLRTPLATLRRLAKAIDAHYTPFVTKSGRQIDNPDEELKEVQRRIRECLLAHQPLPDWMHGCITGRSPFTNAAVHAGQPSLSRVDVKRFFPSVTNRMVHQVFLRLGFGPKPARLLTLLTTRGGHLPQGAPTSDRLANLAIAPAAVRMEPIFRRLNLTPSVYLDDFGFSGLRAREAMGEVIAELRTEGLAVRHKKTRHYGATTAHIITGYTTNSAAGPSVSRKDRSVIRAAIHRLVGARRRGEPTLEPERSVRGRLAYLRRTNPGATRRFERQLLRDDIDIKAKLQPACRAKTKR